jgi:cAMP phosphodiesterase
MVKGENAMKIHILGAHSTESHTAGCTCFLIDDVLAVDAGALTSTLSFAEEQNLKAVLLTHRHYDHTKDIPILGMNFTLHEKTLDIYSTTSVYEALAAHLLNNTLYPNYFERPTGKPTVRFHVIEPGRTETIAGYSVLPVAVNHAVPTVGFQITSTDGKKVFITSDTGPGLAEVWRQVSPELLIIELSLLNKYDAFARESGHLTPALLLKELESFREIKNYLPEIIAVHMNPLEERDIKAEISLVEKILKTKIRFGKKGMKISL